MKKVYACRLIFLSFIFMLCSIANLSAQEIWNGMGDGFSWNDSANWESGNVPAEGAIVEIGKDVTITGTVPNTPSRIKIKNKKTVTLDVSMNIGDGVIEDHGISMGKECTLNLGVAGNNNTFTFFQTDNKQGIVAFGSSDSVTVNIAAGTVLSFESGLNAINISNDKSFFNNHGTINIGSQIKTGIKTTAAFVNDGSLNITEVLTDGIQVNGGTFENTVLGTITSSTAKDDALELLGDCVFTNYGVMDLMASDTAASANNPLAVGKDTTLATFINEVSGILNADGGADTISRAISVNAMGTLVNKGEINTTNGDEKGRFYNRGTTTNDLGSIMNLNDGRANINQGTFTNNGLVKSTFDGAGMLTNGTAINNAFFEYANSNNFSIGGGTITDNGLNVNNAKVDAAGSCTIDIAETAYEYYFENTSLGMTDATGALTFADNSLPSDSIELTTVYDGVVVTVVNICESAVMMSSSIFSPKQAESLFLFPSLVNHQRTITIDLLEMNSSEPHIFEVVDLNGKNIQSFTAQGGNYISFFVDKIPNGMYFIHGRNQNNFYLGKFIIAK